MDQLSVFLRSAREIANLTQGETAKKMGYSTPQFVSNWERGIAPFPVQKAKVFIRITKCDGKALQKHVLNRFSSKIEKYFVEKKK